MDEQSKNIIGAEDQSKKPVGGGEFCTPPLDRWMGLHVQTCRTIKTRSNRAANIPIW